MIGSLKSFFQEKVAPASAQDDTDRLQVATCALLLEAAHADDDFSDEEMVTIMALVAKRFQMTDQEASELLHVADEERTLSGDLYQFARLVNDSFTRERKFAVIELLWQVVYSDGVLEAHEDSLMHKMGKMLGVRHEELMALKANVKRDLGL
ncbi:MAG: putative tellurite resistance protein B-like protein [Candidatus Krumholzibacteriia bacterium]|jgi:uncharacterized tellurite resistance protein B-like protein